MPAGLVPSGGLEGEAAPCLPPVSAGHWPSLVSLECSCTTPVSAPPPHDLLPCVSASKVSLSFLLRIIILRAHPESRMISYPAILYLRMCNDPTSKWGARGWDLDISLGGCNSTHCNVNNKQLAFIVDAVFRSCASFPHSIFQTRL